MEFTILRNGNVIIEDAAIKWWTFSGMVTENNRNGDKKFTLIIPNQDIANELSDLGYNVKIRPAYDEGGEPNMYLEVKVKYHEKEELRFLNPDVYLISNRKKTLLDDESIRSLDGADTFERIDLEIKMGRWKRGNMTGTTAYVKEGYFTLPFSRLAARYAEEEFPCE